MKLILKILKTYIKEVFSIPKINKRIIKAIAIIMLFIGTTFAPAMIACTVLCHLTNNPFLIFVISLMVALISCRGTIRTIDKLEDDIFD